jgi:hypothetical protein
MKEQYQAQRCALFHAKVSENPRLPGASSARAELASATKRLGILYARLAGLITGAGFAGGAMTYAGFESMMEPIAASSIYVSTEPEFSLDSCKQTSAEFTKRAAGQPGVHHLAGRWATELLPSTHLRRVGTVQSSAESLVEGFSSPAHIELTGVDMLQCIVQIEMANAQNLREWFL